MNQLQILIRKSGYTIYNGIQKRDIVSDIQSIDDALEIFCELSCSMDSPPTYTNSDWMIVPGILASE